MTIRAATEQDLAGIFAIYDHEVLSGICTFETTVKSPEERIEWFARHGPARYPLLVAEEGGAISGWAGLSAWSPRQAYVRTAENSVYVASSARGRGTGRLLQELLAAAQETPVKVLVGRIVQPNVPSVRLHESLGFKPVGVMRRVGEKFGKLLDVLIMDVHLDETAA